VGRRNCFVTRTVCLERGGINNDLGEKVLIFRYDFGMCLVFVVGEVRKKSVSFFFCGGVVVDLMWSYHSRENCNLSRWILSVC